MTSNALSQVEREVEDLLAKDEAGEVDNVFDIVAKLMELDDLLPRTSSLRPRWDTFVAECNRAMISASRRT